MPNLPAIAATTAQSREQWPRQPGNADEEEECRKEQIHVHLVAQTPEGRDHRIDLPEILHQEEISQNAEGMNVQAYKTAFDKMSDRQSANGNQGDDKDAEGIDPKYAADEKG